MAAEGRKVRLERHVLFWLVAAVVAAMAIGLLREVLLPFVAGMVAAYFLSPVADRITAFGLPRAVAAGLMVLVVGCLIVLLVVLVAPALLDQAQQIAVALPGELEKARAAGDEWARTQFGDRFPEVKAGLDRALKGLGDNWTTLAAVMATALWDQGGALFNFLALMLITPLVIFYMLADWPRIVAQVDSLLPRDHAPTVRRLATEIDGSVSAFIRGQGTICLILGSFYALGLSSVGLKYGLLVGLMTGLMSFVPIIGWTLGLITATTLALVQFWPDWWPVLGVIGVLLTGITVDTAFLSPNIVGSKIGLHPVWLIFALIVFSFLFGLVGALVAVPFAAAIAVLVRFALERYRASDVYQGGESRVTGSPARRVEQV